MKLYKEKMTTENGYSEGMAAEVLDSETAQVAASYKVNVCKNFKSINPEQIDYNFAGSIYYVTRKYDGELAVIFWNGELFTVNSGSRVRMGLPCMEEAAKALAAARIGEAIIPAELYVDETSGRSRVFDVLKALSKPELHSTLRLAPFDIVQIDGEPSKASYEEVHQKLTYIFGAAETCKPVRMQKTDSKNVVKELFTKWVEEESGEGLVVRSELPIVYKIKPRYSIDAAVIGFSEGALECKGQVRSLLLALMPEDGKYQIIGKTGNGFEEGFKKQLFERLTPLVIQSKYIETDSNHTAFRMVKPELVIELAITDVLFESTSGPIANTVLAIVDDEYRRVGSANGISVVFPVFQRIRDDKTPNPQDVRLSQISDFMVNPVGGEESAGALPASEILKREVYIKKTGSKLMVQKFMVWKTNKEKNRDYLAYVMYYANFSSERKDPLATEVCVSNSQEQIMEILDSYLAENVKKGWVKATE